MLFPILALPINLDKMINPDTHLSLDPETGLVDYMMAGKSYLSITSTTKSLYGAFQLLSWTFKEVAMCPIEYIKCSNYMQDLS